MAASSKLIEQCSLLDLEIKARQKKFGVDLYNLLEQQGPEEDTTNKFLFQIQELFLQVQTEIVRYHDKLPDKNKRRRKLRVGSISGAMTGQWELQRKEKFGLACFDIVFDMLGTSTSPGGHSLLSVKEQKVHALIQKAVNDVLDLERRKEDLCHEDETPVEPHDGDMFCGVFPIVCCF